MEAANKLKFIDAAAVLWVESAVDLMLEIDEVVRRHELHHTGQAPMFAELRDGLALQLATFVEGHDWRGLAHALRAVFTWRSDVVRALQTEDSEMPATFAAAHPVELERVLDGHGRYFALAVAEATPHAEQPEDEDAPF